MSAATIAAVLADAERRIGRTDARALLAHAFARDAAFLIAHRDDVMDSSTRSAFEKLVSRRGAGEPVAYMMGEREFFGRPFRVTRDVLIPRPETELLIDLALERIAPDEAAAILDLGTGSGCIGVTIALERPHAHVTCVDRSKRALAIAQANAARLGARNVGFVESDWYAALGARRFALIVANPPYVAAEDPHLAQGDLRFEPQEALVGGADGLDAIRDIAAGARQRADIGAWLLLEHGFDQGAPARELLGRLGFSDVLSVRDLAGIERVTGGRLRA